MTPISCPECGTEISIGAEICPSCKSDLPPTSKDLLKKEKGNFKENKVNKNKSSFFGRHWRGELSLAVSYWINIFLLTILIKIGLESFNSFVNQAQSNLRFLYFCVILLHTTFIFTIYPWQIIGTWRSANLHIKRTSKRFWAILAKVVIVLGILGTIGQMPTIFPQLKEYWKIAFAKGDFSKMRITLLPNGKELEIVGGIPFGLTDEVRKIFKNNPNIQVIRLDSFGGRVGEAHILRNFIKEKKLITYSARGCLSACTIPFMAGKERILNQGAQLGFHKYSFPGLSDKQFKETYRISKEAMISDGIEKRFVDKAFTAQSDDMWYPSHDELVKANVVTRLSDGKEFSVPSKTDDIELEQIEQAFSSIPLFKEIQKYEAEVYQALLLEAKLRYSQGAGRLNMSYYLNKKIAKIAGKKLPIAPDKELVSFARVLVTEIRELTAKDPNLCLKMLFPEKFGQIVISDYLSKETLKADNEALSGLIRESMKSPQRTPNEAEVSEYIDLVSRKLYEAYGNKVSYFENPNRTEISKKEICHMFADLYDFSSAMPLIQSGPTLRFMFAQNKGFKINASQFN
ncbi:MAG: hypothetical protein NPINA01_21930 [Nitrospinaceae bacterium]|nr:MAG: hypothetical protein NPINA01_21930 [Nitrospinaceae bacterium]